MYAIVRNYSGLDAAKLFDLLEERKTEVETIIGSVTGLVSYTLIRTDDGGTTVTVCEDKTGTDASMQMARDWIQDNAADLNLNPPTVSEGPVKLNIN